MRSFLLDLKLVFRQLRQSPGFTATAVLMLAFGIGATTAIFSIVEGVLLRPLPFPDSDRLMVLSDRFKRRIWAATARSASRCRIYAPTPGRTRLYRPGRISIRRLRACPAPASRPR